MFFTCHGILHAINYQGDLHAMDLEGNLSLSVLWTETFLQEFKKQVPTTKFYCAITTG